MATHELREMTLGEILDGALAIYRAEFGTLVSIAIMFQGVPAIMNLYVELGGGIAYHPGVWLTAGLVSLAGGLIAVAATVKVISDVYLGVAPEVGDAVRYALERFGRLFVAGALKYLVLGLGFLAFIVPGLILLCGLAVVVPVVVLERGMGPGEALARSWELTRHFKSKAFVLYFVVFFFVYLPFVIAGVLMVLVPAMQTMLQIGAQVAGLMVYPIVACVFTLFYYDLRVRKDALDLEHLIDQLEPIVEPMGR